MNDRERHAADLDMQANALEVVADRLEDDGLYEATLIRASVKSIRDACQGLNDIAFQYEKAREGAA